MTPEDVAATVYTLPGTDPTAALIDGQIKPYTLVHGKPVRGLV